ncbi:MAG: hypothetical protein JHC78_09055 [Ilumatobacteraceae bacterium]|jgi:hypothetical protein|nr:hypothetical protein [Ilumatobacteraceae bacterium]
MVMAHPHDVPTSAQLLEAVRQWLERDVMPAVDARLQFHGRVAMNLLAMVEREIEIGPDQAVQHSQRLSTLGCADDSELAQRIKNGEMDDRLDEVRALVYASVIDKLQVANPKYLEK